MKKIKCIKGTKYAVKNGDIFKEYELLKKIYSHSLFGTKKYSYTEVEKLKEADLVIIKHPITNCRYTLLANRFIEVKDNPVPSLESKEFKDFLSSQGMLGSDEHNKICYKLFKKAYEYFQNGVEANKEQPIDSILIEKILEIDVPQVFTHDLRQNIIEIIEENI